jgi:hypothetical protein
MFYLDLVFRECDMRFGKFFAVVSAVALIAAPVAAQTAAPANSTASAKGKRSVYPEAKMGGDSTLLLIIAVALMGVGIFVLAGSDDKPASP